MDMTEKTYLYAEKTEQIKKANRFLTIGIWVYYTWVLIIVWVATVRRIQPFWFSAAITTTILLFSVVEGIDYRHNKFSKKAKYIASFGLFLVSALMAFGFNNYYVRFMAVTPFIGTILYYDPMFSKMTGIIFTLLNVASNVYKIGLQHKYSGELVIEQMCATLAIGIMFLIIYITSNIGKKFNYHTIHSLRAEQETQKQMLDDVLTVAGAVRTGTQNAMGIVHEVYSSTDVVNTAMQEISNNTRSTAENIQVQTEMTHSIQNSIEQTNHYSENMVKIAQKSEECNRQGMEVMKNLKKHSAQIEYMNTEAADSMYQLQERMHAVRGIADTIFEISSQTNLLALNASIESARAGEAGRGFAVVAEQIRELAVKTRQETEHIASILEELSANAQHAAKTVGTSMEASKEQEAMIEQVSVSFDGISGSVHTLIEDIGEIDRMLSGLSNANQQIVENIMQLSAATQEVTASSEQAEKLSKDNLSNADQMKALLDKVLEVSHQLDVYNGLARKTMTF